jgi:hypothetical protein
LRSTTKQKVSTLGKADVTERIVASSLAPRLSLVSQPRVSAFYGVVERWTGVLEPLNDPAYFAQVTVDPEAGTIVWPDGIDLAPEPLCEQARAHPLVAA